MKNLLKSGLTALVVIAASISNATEWISLEQTSQMSGKPATPSRISKLQVAEATAEDVRLGASLPGFYHQTVTLEDGFDYNTVILPGAGRMPEGHPDVPAFGKWVLVPNGAEIKITVEPGEPVLLSGYNIPPVQPPQVDSSDISPPFIKDNAIYGTNETYPAVFAKTDGIRTIRGQSTALVWLFPYRWNPVTRELRIYPDLTATISFVGGGTSAELRYRSPAFDNQFRRMAPNANAVLALPPASRMEPDGEADLSAMADEGSIGGCDLLIICPDLFVESANTLAGWKRKRGLSTTVCSTTETGSTADDIRNYISNAYSNWIPAPSYVLLIGDADQLPVHYGVAHGSHASAVATDLYYADMDNPYDRIADLAVGRWPVETASQAMNCALRTIEYERTPPSRTSYPHFYANAAICGAFQDGAYEDPLDGYANRRFAKTSEDIRNFLLSEGYNPERIYTTYNGYDSSTIYPAYWTQNSMYIFENDISGAPLPSELLKPAFPWNGGAADIQAAVNTGTFMLTHRDHGNRGGWGEPALNRSNVDALANGHLRPVVFTINCQTAWFDNETDAAGDYTASTSECFSEHWIRHSSGGAIGLIGATRNSFSGINDRLVWGWMDAIWPSFIEFNSGNYSGAGAPVYRMGDVLNYGRNYLLTKYAADGTIDIALEEYIWIGDPTLEIWTGIPGDLVVSHPASQPMGAITFNVNVDQDGAVVCCTFNDRILGTGIAAGGVAQVIFDFVPAGPGTMDITVTHHNDLPYEGTCTIYNAGLPTVSTDGTVSNISPTAVMVGGSVVSQGSAAVTARGICWGTAPHPSTADSCVAAGSGTGPFTAILSGLSIHWNYYARAYAVNALGTAYGDTVAFRTTYLDRFEWSAIEALQYPGIPFPVQITALNQYGDTFEFFTGTVALSGMADQTGDSSIVITECSLAPDFIEIENASGQTTNTTDLLVAVSANYSDINSVNSVYWTLPASMTANQVAYKTDNTNEAYWGSNILWNPGNNGWAMIIDDSDGSVVDFIAWGWSASEISAMSPVIHGHTVSIGDEFLSDGITSSGSETIQRRGPRDANTAADFAWGSPDSKGVHNTGLTFPLSGPPAPITISPVSTGTFIDATWSGLVTISHGAENVFLTADDGSGHVADSSIFNVVSGHDADADSIPDWWEIMYFGNCVNCIATNNNDWDPHNNWQEYIAGTDPTNGNSCFMVTDHALQAGTNGFIVEWNPVAGRTYTVLWSPNLAFIGFTPVICDIEFPQNHCTDTVHSAEVQSFYRVDVQLK